MYRHLIAAALAVSAHGAFAADYDNKTNHYTLKVDAAMRRVHVDADVFVKGNVLSLFNVQPIAGVKNGQAEFIEALRVLDAKGQPLKAEDKGEGDWEIAGDQRVRLSYDVRLDHDKYEWPGGNEEVLYKTDEGLMAVMQTLFLVPGDAMPGKTEVRFDLPAGWKANTPWTVNPDGKSYMAATRRELVNNVVFLGTARSETIHSGGIELSLVMGKRYWPQRDAFVQLMDKQLQSYLKVFGRPPLANKYLIVINQGDTGDGGAFAGSFSQYLKDDGDAVSRPIWGRVMAHELAHFWNGHSLVPKDGNEEWFKEGVTDYLTVQAMARNGIGDRVWLMQQLENLARGQVIARYAQGLKVTVREAVKDKHRNWMLVYGGGSIAALTMDVELRKATGGKVGLEHLMKAMFDEFAAPGKTYTQADIVRVGKALAGVDLDPVLNKIVATTTVPDLKPMFADIGMRMETFGFLEAYGLRDPKATAEQKQRFKDIFGMDW